MVISKAGNWIRGFGQEKDILDAGTSDISSLYEEFQGLTDWWLTPEPSQLAAELGQLAAEFGFRTVGVSVSTSLSNIIQNQ